MVFRLVPQSVTLNDLERRNGPQVASTSLCRCPWGWVKYMCQFFLYETWYTLMGRCLADWEIRGPLAKKFSSKT